MKIVTLISLAAAAGMVAGCSSDEYANSNTAGPYGYNYGGDTKYVLTLDQLPQPAQIAILAQINGQPIARIRQEIREGKTVYRVDLQRADWATGRPSLVVAADGALLSESGMPIYEAAGAEYRQGAAIGATGVTPDPGPSSNPASPTPAFPPSSVLFDR